MEISKKMNILLKNNTTSEIKVSLQTQALKDIEKKEQRNLFEHDLHAAIIADRSIDVDNKFDIKIEEIRLKPSESYKLEYDKLIGNVFVFLGVAAFIVAIVVPLLIKKQAQTEIDLGL
mgnify:CR=1 FL=1